MLDERARAELLAGFWAELHDHCQALNHAFLALEKEPDAPQQRQLFEQAFRSAHSLKGAARSVGLRPVEALAHGLEGLLSRVGHGDLELSPALFDLLYAAVDTLTIQSDAEAPTNDSDLEQVLRRLEAVQPSGPAETPSAPPALVVASAAHSLPAVVPVAAPPLSRRPHSTMEGSGDTLRLPVARLEQLQEQLGELVVPRLELDEALGTLVEARRQVEAWHRDWRKVRPRLRQLEREGLLTRMRPVGPFLERYEANLAALEAVLGAVLSQLAAPSAQFRHLTDELQDEVKRLQMLPFGNLAHSLERTVRDLARSLGKEARLVLVGIDTELDRRILDEMKDPLMHLLRNAVDHGIEMPAERQRRGKPSIGSVIVTVDQRGGAIIIEVEDDGAGLDPYAIRRAAAERGLVRVAELDALSPAELLRLIFLPGLSSRHDVSEVSGRGVGLDVVARTVERLDGRVEVASTPGHGTHFLISLPLTLATMRAVLVEAGGALYALPTAALERIVRSDQLGELGGRLVLQDRGEAVPAVALAPLLDARADSQLADVGARPLLALLHVGTQRVALAIDRVVAEQEIVVKPLGHPVRRLRHVAGATILGTGRVIPILNPGDLVRSATKSSLPPPPARPTEPGRRRLRVLVADDSHTTRSLERYILEAAGYEVELAGDGAEALALLQEHACDVLVSDFDMPRLDGVALTTRLRQDPKFRELPVILVTSLESTEDRERGLQAGADAYIVKSSFDQDHLLRTIRELT